jgi:hypothetical protein
MADDKAKKRSFKHKESHSYCTLMDSILIRDQKLAKRLAETCMSGLFNKPGSRYTFFMPDYKLLQNLSDDEFKNQIKAHLILKAFTVEQFNNIIDKAKASGTEPNMFNLITDVFKIEKSKHADSIIINGIEAKHLEEIPGKGQLYSISKLLPVKKPQKGSGYSYSQNDTTFQMGGGINLPSTVITSGIPLHLSLLDEIIRDYANVWKTNYRFKQGYSPYYYLSNDLLSFLHNSYPIYDNTLYGIVNPTPSYTFLSHNLLNIIPNDILNEFRSSEYFTTTPAKIVLHNDPVSWFAFPSYTVKVTSPTSYYGMGEQFGSGNQFGGTIISQLLDYPISQPTYSTYPLSYIHQLPGLLQNTIYSYQRFKNYYDTADFENLHKEFKTLTGKSVYELYNCVENILGKKCIYRRIYPDTGKYLSGIFALNSLLRKIESQSMIQADIVARHAFINAESIDAYINALLSYSNVLPDLTKYITDLSTHIVEFAQNYPSSPDVLTELAKIITSLKT